MTSAPNGGSGAVVTSAPNDGSGAVVTSAPNGGSGAVVSEGVNTLRGEFAAVLAGEAIRFDTALATVAVIEERCGGIAIVEAVNRAVFGRRAADHLALLAGALIASGRPDAEAVAARTSLAEAEAFILALMGALGFAVARKSGGDDGAAPPFPAASATSGASDGPDGAASRWVP